MEYNKKFKRRINFWAKIPLPAQYVARFSPGRVEMGIFGLAKPAEGSALEWR